MHSIETSFIVGHSHCPSTPPLHAEQHEQFFASVPASLHRSWQSWHSFESSFDEHPEAVTRTTPATAMTKAPSCLMLHHDHTARSRSLPLDCISARRARCVPEASEITRGHRGRST